MRNVLLIAGIVLFCVAAVFILAGSAAINPLGLIAVGLACTSGARVV